MFVACRAGKIIMKNPVYKLIELTGTSPTSIEDAVASAIRRAHQTVRDITWFEVIDTRGNIDKGEIRHWQVTIKVGFALGATTKNNTR
jgi:flavin-binding protein dodecin